MFTLLRHQSPAVVHILTHSGNFAFGPNSRFKKKCRARAVLGLKNEVRSQHCSTPRRFQPDL